MSLSTKSFRAHSGLAVRHETNRFVYPRPISIFCFIPLDLKVDNAHI
jgi:hypothetical protein